jgi:hypothetical protein
MGITQASDWFAAKSAGVCSRLTRHPAEETVPSRVIETEKRTSAATVAGTQALFVVGCSANRGVAGSAIRGDEVLRCPRSTGRG